MNLIRIHKKATTRKLPLLEQDYDFLLVSSDIPAQSGSTYQSKNRKEKLVTHSGKAYQAKNENETLVVEMFSIEKLKIKIKVT